MEICEFIRDKNRLDTPYKGGNSKKQKIKEWLCGIDKVTDKITGFTNPIAHLLIDDSQYEWEAVLEEIDFQDKKRNTKKEFQNNTLFRGIKNNPLVYNNNNIVIDRRDYDMNQLIDEYIRQKSNSFDGKVYLVKNHSNYIPTIKRNSVSISNILLDLIKLNSKFDLIDKNKELTIEDINIALNFALNIISNKNDVHYIIDSNRAKTVEERIELLQRYTWTTDEVKSIYSFDITDKNLIKHYSSWLRFKYKEPFYEGYFNIWRLEEFLRWDKKVPINILAISMGMTVKSLYNIFENLQEEIKNQSIKISGGLINDDSKQILNKLFFINTASLYSNYDESIRKLHSNAEMLLNIKIEPLICETSKIIDEQNKLKVASTYDDLTGEPVCDQYSIRLDLGKPISLKPNICSIKTYVKYKDILKQYVKGEVDKKLIKMVEDNLNAC